MGDWVKLVVVAAGAAHGEPEQSGGGSRGAVNGVFDQVLFGNCAALIGRDVVAIKAAGYFLLGRCVWQEVAGQLFNHEAVIGHVVTEGC